MWKLIVHVLERESSMWGARNVVKVEVSVPNIVKGKEAIRKIMKEGIYSESSENPNYYPPSLIRKIEIVAV